MKSTANSGFKMTAAGSDASHSFCYRGKNNRLYVFEAAVDLLSYITLNKSHWTENSYVSLNGLSPKAMTTFLAEQKNITEIHICTDNDIAGIESYDKFKDMLIETGYSEENIVRELPIFKDWNEHLKYKNNVPPILSQPHPKKEALHKAVRQLCRINENDENQYAKSKKLGFAYTENFYAKQVKHEFVEIENALKEKKTDMVHAIERGLIRIFDLSATVIAMADTNESKTQAEKYENFLKALENGYKPYKDKEKWSARFRTMKKEIESINGEIDLNSQSLFTFAEKLAKLSMGAFLYVETDYKAELERRNAVLAERRKEESSAEEGPNNDCTIQQGV